MRYAPGVALVILSLLSPFSAWADHAQHGDPIPEPSVCQTYVRYSPHGGIAPAVISMFDAAQSVILVAMYSLTHPDIVSALISARDRGVEVAVKLDKVQSAGQAQQAIIALLLAAGISVEVSSQSRQLHDKFAVIDYQFVLTGSFNWSLNAENRNRENLLILECSDLAQNFAAEWAAIQPDQP